MLDEKALLAGLSGDVALLRKLIELFLADAPKLLAAIRKAITAGNSKTLQKAAHTLKGSIGNFTTKEPFEAAARLEFLAREENLAGAREAWVTLRKQMGQLQEALRRLRQSLRRKM